MKYNYVAGVVTQEGPSGAEGAARERILISQDAPRPGCRAPPHSAIARLDQRAARHTCQVQSPRCQGTEFAFLRLLRNWREEKKIDITSNDFK